MENCLFCKITNAEIPAKKIAENDGAIAFLDINPISYGHTLIIPKKHYKNLVETTNEDLNYVLSLAKDICNKLEGLNINISGFNFLSNMNESAGQVIMHFHLHVIPKYLDGSGLLSTSNKMIIKKDIEEKINSLII